MTVDGRIARGDRTRAAVLDRAVVRATEDGLDGLSLGQLATDLGVSKSGLFAHWRSKEELQLATVETGRAPVRGRGGGGCPPGRRGGPRARRRGAPPRRRAPRGVRRLGPLHDPRIRFYEPDVLPGGGFFAKAQCEFSA